MTFRQGAHRFPKNRALRPDMIGDFHGLARRLGVAKKLVAVRNVRGGVTKASMIHNSLTPQIEVDPETYEVRADGELLTCEPATVLPMAQRYFLF